MCLERVCEWMHSCACVRPVKIERIKLFPSLCHSYSVCSGGPTVQPGLYPCDELRPRLYTNSLSLKWAEEAWRCRKQMETQGGRIVSSFWEQTGSSYSKRPPDQPGVGFVTVTRPTRVPPPFFSAPLPRFLEECGEIRHQKYGCNKTRSATCSGGETLSEDE